MSPRTLLLARIMATATAVGVTLSLSLTLLSLVLENAAVPRALIGLNAASGGFGALLVAPLVPALVRWSPVRAMALGIATCTAVLLLLPLGIDLWLWFGLRVLFSAGIALLFIVSESAVNALVDDAVRGRVIGLYGTLFSVGYVVGPALVAAVGSAGWTPFLVGAAILASAFVPLFGAGGIDAALRDGDGHGVEPLRPMRRLVTAPLPFVAALLFGAIETAHFSFLPIFGLARGLDEPSAALLLTAFIAGNIVLQLPIGWAADRLGFPAVLAGCGVVATASHLALDPALAAGWPVWPLLLVLGGAVGAVYSLGLGLLGRSFTTGGLAAANTLFVIMIQAGVLVGPLGAGAAIEAAGPAGFPLLAAALAALLAAAAPMLRRAVP